MITGMVTGIMPAYQFGDDSLYAFLKENIQYPKDVPKRDGKVVVVPAEEIVQAPTAGEHDEMPLIGMLCAIFFGRDLVLVRRHSAPKRDA